MIRTLRVVALAALLCLTGVETAEAAIELSASTREVYAELPFTLSVSVSGYEEKPEPQVSELKIPGCDVTYLGVSPRVQSMVQILNGRASETRSTTFVYTYRVTPKAPGTFQIPALRVSQGSKVETSQAAQFAAREIAPTPDMQIRMTLPDRAVWVGETFPVTLDWYLKKNANDQTFVIPLFDKQDSLEVAPAPTTDERAPRLRVAAGARELELPFERGPAGPEDGKPSPGGEGSTRFRFHALVTATRPGALEVEPARVVASLEIGQGSDRFGFPVARTQLFKAEDVARRLEVKALPLDGRPASFRGAVGTGFAIEVKADRSVVRVGEPIVLEVVVRGHGKLEGLTLPPLDVEGGLPRELFSVPEDAPPGEMLADAGKRFRVVVRVRSDKARGIPQIPFSFWNPVTAAYETVRSQPIALAVEGSAVVGADSVVAATGSLTTSTPSAAQRTKGVSDAASLTGADLALSSPDAMLRRAASGREALPEVFFLHLAALAALGILAWSRRTRGARARASSARAALGLCQGAIAAAERETGKVAAARIAAALESLRRELGLEAGSGEALQQKLERVAFDPAASSAPLESALVAEAKTLAASSAHTSSPSKPHRAPLVAASVLAGVTLLVGADLFRRLASGREPADETRVVAARESYRAALGETDRDRRVGAFEHAETLLGELARVHGDCPELLGDWGNAALGAQDLGTAVVAFRRALVLDPGLSRARENLTWVRSRMPAWLPVPQSSGFDSLAGWSSSRPAASRAASTALAFALAVALLCAFATPEAEAFDRRRSLRWLALAPALVWLALVASIAFERDGSHDAVIIGDGAVVRAADSVGAPRVFSQPLPSGAEVVVAESREGWARVELASGARGWVLESALALVAH